METGSLQASALLFLLAVKFECSTCSDDEDNSSFLVFQSHHLKCQYEFYFHCIFIIYLVLFYVNDSVGMRNNFSTTSMLCDRYSGFPPLHRKANKVLQWGVSLPFIGSLRV